MPRFTEDNETFVNAGSLENVNQIIWQGLPGKYLAVTDGGLYTTPDYGATWGPLRPNSTFGTSWPGGAKGYQVAFARGPRECPEDGGYNWGAFGIVSTGSLDPILREGYEILSYESSSNLELFTIKKSNLPFPLFAMNSDVDGTVSTVTMTSGVGGPIQAHVIYTVLTIATEGIPVVPVVTTVAGFGSAEVIHSKLSADGFRRLTVIHHQDDVNIESEISVDFGANQSEVVWTADSTDSEYIITSADFVGSNTGEQDGNISRAFVGGLPDDPELTAIDDTEIGPGPEYNAYVWDAVGITLDATATILANQIWQSVGYGSQYVANRTILVYYKYVGWSSDPGWTDPETGTTWSQPAEGPPDEFNFAAGTDVVELNRYFQRFADTPDHIWVEQGGPFPYEIGLDFLVVVFQVTGPNPVVSNDGPGGANVRSFISTQDIVSVDVEITHDIEGDVDWSNRGTVSWAQTAEISQDIVQTRKDAVWAKGETISDGEIVSGASTRWGNSPPKVSTNALIGDSNLITNGDSGYDFVVQAYTFGQWFPHEYFQVSAWFGVRLRLP